MTLNYKMVNGLIIQEPQLNTVYNKKLNNFPSC